MPEKHINIVSCFITRECQNQRLLPAALSFFCFSICLLVMLSRSRFRFSQKHHKIFFSGLWIKEDEQLSEKLTSIVFQLTFQPSCNKACQTWLKSKLYQQVLIYSLQKSTCAFQKPVFFQCSLCVFRSSAQTHWQLQISSTFSLELPLFSVSTVTPAQKQDP